ncbi:MAG: hypothetical protein OEV94_01745 [Deltaproteobacteria bacterium]|nr:hypothetical protein [Deltaproteobacteria bacterium]
MIKTLRYTLLAALFLAATPVWGQETAGPAAKQSPVIVNLGLIMDFTAKDLTTNASFTYISHYGYRLSFDVPFTVMGGSAENSYLVLNRGIYHQNVMINTFSTGMLKADLFGLGYAHRLDAIIVSTGYNTGFITVENYFAPMSKGATEGYWLTLGTDVGEFVGMEGFVLNITHEELNGQIQGSGGSPSRVSNKINTLGFGFPM